MPKYLTTPNYSNTHTRPPRPPSYTLQIGEAVLIMSLLDDGGRGGGVGGALPVLQEAQVPSLSSRSQWVRYRHGRARVVIE